MQCPRNLLGRRSGALADCKRPLAVPGVPHFRGCQVPMVPTWVCAPSSTTPYPINAPRHCQAMKHAHLPLLAVRTGRQSEHTIALDPPAWNFRPWGNATITMETESSWIYHVQAIAEAAQAEEQERAVQQWHSSALVVAGSAAERSFVKPEMQDRHVKVQNLAAKAADHLVAMGAHDSAFVLQDLQAAFTAVFDGHGGTRTVRTAARVLPNVVASSVGLWQALGEAWRPLMGEESVRAVSRALQKAFLEVDDEILTQSAQLPPGEVDGTTALLGLQVGQHLFVANVGDSRAVLSRGGVAVRMTQDHTPDVPDERRRIEAVGGVIRQHKGVWRLCLQSTSRYVLKISSVSRALGDYDYKVPTPLMSAQPDVFYWALHPRYDRFAVYATDGVWGVLTDQQVVDLVEGVLKAARAQQLTTAEASQLAAAAVVQAAQEAGSYDDITSVVTLFNWRGE